VRRGVAPWPSLVRRWAVFAAPVGALVVFRAVYYGTLVPNTFHAKVGGGLSAVARGAAYAGEFGVAALPLLLLAVVGAVAAWRGASSAGRLAPALVMLVTGVFFAYVVYVGGDYKPTFRFFAVPAVALAAFAGAGSSGWLAGPAGRAWHARRC